MGSGIGAMERHLAAAVKAADSAIGEGYSEKAAKAASHVAWLTKQMAQVADGLRKIEAHDQAQLRKLTPALVYEWIRALSDDERAEVARRIDSIASGSTLFEL